MSGAGSQPPPVLIRDDLGFERVAFLLARIELLLSLVQTGACHGRFKAINEHALDFVRRPLGLRAMTFFGCPFLFRKEVAQDRQQFVEGVFRAIGTVAKEHPDDRHD